MDNNMGEIYSSTSKTPRSRKKTTLIAIVVILAIILSMVAGCFIGISIYNVGRDGKQMVEDMPQLLKAYNYLKEYYYKDISWDEFQFMVVSGMLSGLNDFCFLNVKDEVSANYELVGLKFSPTKYNEYYISEVKGDSPASKAKSKEDPNVTLERGDEVYAINGVRVRGAGVDFFAKQNSASKTVSYEIYKESNGKKYTFENMTKAILIEKNATYQKIDDKTGYIKFSSFSLNATQDVATAVSRFIDNGNSNLILDLRGNGGGSISILKEIAPFFVKDASGSSQNLFLMELEIKKKNIVETYNTFSDIKSISVQDASGNQKNLEIKYIGNYVPNFKMTVLTDGGTASASEGLLGAINFYGTGVQIGTLTYGKGVAQGVFDFTNEYEIAITMAYYYIQVKDENGNVSKVTIHQKGIAPADAYKVENDKMCNDIKREPALIKALEYFSVN